MAVIMRSSSHTLHPWPMIVAAMCLTFVGCSRREKIATAAPNGRFAADLAFLQQHTSVVVLGVNLAVSTTVLLLALSLVPPAIVWFLWRGAASPTAHDVMYAANTSKQGRS